MENISLGQIVTILSFLSVLIGVITSVITFFKLFITKLLKPINQKIDELQELSSQSRNNIERELIKMILVNFMNDVEQGTNKSQIQKQNAFELYDRYQELGGNSYIHDKWEKLIKENKI